MTRISFVAQTDLTCQDLPNLEINAQPLLHVGGWEGLLLLTVVLREICEVLYYCVMTVRVAYLRRYCTAPWGHFTTSCSKKKREDSTCQ
jgi:hypothetical protein